jgi:predicted nucleotidyltransferase
VSFPLERHTIFVCLAGSQAHGTAREVSDLDLRGVCIAPLASRLSPFESFEQYEGPATPALAAAVLPRLQAHSTASRRPASEAECVVYELTKLVRLCVAANPNALEILFADERDWLVATPAWLRLHAERHAFLTRKVQQTFLGYAMAQLKRIKTHRSWLLHPPAGKPSREDFGLPASGGTLGRDDQNRIEQALAEKLRSYGIDDLDMPKPLRIAVQERLDAFYRDVLEVAEEEVESRMRAVASAALHLPPDVVASLNAEKRYRAAMKHWESYQTWQAERNEARAALEREHGYDTKHAMHLIRLMRMGLEVLERGELIVRRPDAAELVAIRDGALSFDELMAAAEELRGRMEEASGSHLPAEVDRERIERLVVELVEEER